jgi:lipid A 3-O-deacylase
MSLVLMIFSMGAGAAAGGDESPGGFAFTGYMENDSSYFMPGSDNDRYYTHGTKFTLTHHPQLGQSVAEKLRTIVPIGGDGTMRSAVGYVIGQDIFTPGDITIAAPQPTDRPWAGWFYGGAYLQREVDDRVFDHFELHIGVVGPTAFADDVQEWIHDTFGADDPLGWDNQLPDEFGIDFTYRRKWKFTLHGENSGDLTIQAIPQAGLTVGNVHRDVGGDVTLRAGVYLPGDFGPGRLEDVVAATGCNPNHWGAYVFARAGGRYVDHNVFIEGSNYHDTPGVAEEPWVGEIQVGVSAYYKYVEVGYAVRWVSEQFKAQDGSQGYGSWMVRLATTF